MDSIGKRPKIETQEQALEEIRRIALDKRGHVMLQDQVDWLELKMKEIGRVAYKGLHLK